ncbi:MAG: PTS glucitol/sorbitol transporter subunit IIA [Ktedonobacteraceae bacterium]
MVAHIDLPSFDMHEAQLFLKYQAVIREIGPMVVELIPHGMLIFFGETAPAELREVALVHNGTQLLSDLEVGDFLKFSPPGDQQSSWYRLTAVGTMANANLAELGHLVIHFDGVSTASLPGTISVEPALAALPPVGTTFELFGREKK